MIICKIQLNTIIRRVFKYDWNETIPSPRNRVHCRWRIGFCDLQIHWMQLRHLSDYIEPVEFDNHIRHHRFIISGGEIASDIKSEYSPIWG